MSIFIHIADQFELFGAKMCLLGVVDHFSISFHLFKSFSTDLRSLCGLRGKSCQLGFDHSQKNTNQMFRRLLSSVLLRRLETSEKFN